VKGFLAANDVPAPLRTIAAAKEATNFFFMLKSLLRFYFLFYYELHLRKDIFEYPCSLKVILARLIVHIYSLLLESLLAKGVLLLLMFLSSERPSK